MPKAKSSTPPPPVTLHRSSTNKMLGGVAGGIAEYLNIDPTVIRILFAIMSFFWRVWVFAVYCFVVAFADGSYWRIA